MINLLQIRNVLPGASQADEFDHDLLTTVLSE